MSDLINRQNALNAFGLSEKTRKYGGDHSGYNTMMLYEIQDILEELPSAEPERKTGKWIDVMVGDMPAQACDQCNTFYPLAYTGGGHRYCPNCGARMEGEKNDK